jgi:8-oxo-dGTP diphosphatase
LFKFDEYLLNYTQILKKNIHIDNYAITLSEPNPSNLVMENISIDCVIFGFQDNELKVLLIQHGRGPMKGHWALPGDYLLKDTSVDDMPHEVLRRLTGLKNVYVEQFGAYGDLNRVFYRRVMTIAYFALISPQKYELILGEGTSSIAWFNVTEIPKLIFDHKDILQDAIQHLKLKARTEPLGFELLNQKFTLTQLQKLYEAIISHKLDTRNFRRKILSLNTLIDLDEVDDSVPYRPPALFSFDYHKYTNVKNEGYYFEIF